MEGFEDIGGAGVADFYAGKRILVTGFTGFLGKILVEKLLYSCPRLDKLYVLIRTKKGKDPMDRCQEVFKTMAFERIRKECPEVLESKVVPISGDMSKENLGLSEEDRKHLADRVQIIFHSAASVRFDDPLRISIQQNLEATKRLVDLSLQMTKLECLLYVSTAYSNCDHLYIEEKLYPPRMHWKDAVKIAERVDPAAIEILTKKCIGELPNTYTFTKSLSEQIINDYRDKLPVVIVRPSIVYWCGEEPLKGWVDSIAGPVAPMLASFFGIQRCNLVRSNTYSNMIFADTVIKATILAARQTVLKKEQQSKQEVIVYNACVPHHMATKCELLPDIIKTMDGRIDPQHLQFHDILLFEKMWIFKFNVFIRHVLPSLFVDLILIIMNKQPMLLNLRRKIMILMTLPLRCFTFNEYRFETDRFENLSNELIPSDKAAFGWKYDAQLVLEAPIHAYEILTKTIAKPIFDDKQTNFRRLKMLYYIDRSAVALVYMTGAWILYYFSIPQNVLNLLIQFCTLPN